MRSGSDVREQQRLAGVKARSDLTDYELEDLATAIENCVARDGQNAASANLPMGSYKHTGVATGSGAASRSEYVSGATLQDGAVWDAGSTGGTSTAFTATLSPAIAAYADKQLFRVKFNAAFGATPTINFNTVGAKKMYWITKAGSVTQLTTNDVPSGYPGLLRYDTSLDSSAGGFMLLNPPAALIASAANTWSAAQTFSAAVTMSGAAINEAQGSDVASASTIDLDAATGNLVDVTGTTTITAVTLSQGRERTVRFTGALTLTHGASLVLPGAANIVTVAGDFAVFRGYAAGVVRCVSFSRISGSRERLTASRTYYVRTDGNDSNTGLVNDAAGAFLTIQKAINVIADTLDNAGYDVTIQSGDGTYTGTVRPRRWVGSGTVTLQGNAGTPANVVISTTSADAIAVDGAGMDFIVKDLEVRTTTSGYGLLVSGPSRLSFSNIRFGACANAHILVDRAGYIRATGNYAIVGNAQYHWLSTNGPGLLYAVGLTITLTGTPAFSATFATAANNSAIVCNSNTFSGAATGTRYSAAANGVINTNGGGASYLPGNAVGSTGTGGQYV